MRPKDPIPQWAQTVLNYVSPGKLWDGQPNQVKPPDSLIQAGLEPSQRVPGPLFNWLLGLIGVHLIHLDAIEAQNWIPEVAIPGLIHPIQSSPSLALDVNQCIWAVGSGSKLMFSYNGIQWEESGAAVSAENLGPIVSCPMADGGYLAAATTQVNPGKVYFKGPTANNDTWSVTTAPNSSTMTKGIWNPTSVVFMFAGKTIANRPGIWICNSNLSTVVQVIPQNQASYTGSMFLMAHSESLGVSLAIGVSNGFSALTLWRSPGDPTIPWDDMGLVSAMLTGAPVDLAWDESRKVFVLICSNGAVYQSTDGTLWNQMAPSSGGPLNFLDSSLAIRGGLYVAVGYTSGAFVPGLYWSVDGGATWNRISYPGDGQPVTMASLDDRFGLLTANGRVDFSLRLK